MRRPVARDRTSADHGRQFVADCAPDSHLRKEVNAATHSGRPVQQPRGRMRLEPSKGLARHPLPGRHGLQAVEEVTVVNHPAHGGAGLVSVLGL
jgi:hypothetical protein